MRNPEVVANVFGSVTTTYRVTTYACRFTPTAPMHADAPLSHWCARNLGSKEKKELKAKLDIASSHTGALVPAGCTLRVTRHDNDLQDASVNEREWFQELVGNNSNELCISFGVSM